MSKKTLQKLSVLPKDFPNVQVVQTRAVKAQVEESDEKNELMDKEYSHTSEVSKPEPKLEPKPEGWNQESDFQTEVQKLKENYKEVCEEEGELKPMLGDPYKIELRDDIPMFLDAPHMLFKELPIRK